MIPPNAVQCTCVWVLHVYMLYTRIITAEPDYILTLLALAIFVPRNDESTNGIESDIHVYRWCVKFMTQMSVIAHWKMTDSDILTMTHPALKLHGGIDGNCRRCPRPLPWCPLKMSLSTATTCRAFFLHCRRALFLHARPIFQSQKGENKIIKIAAHGTGIAALMNDACAACTSTARVHSGRRRACMS